jgi:hypothetical protein
MRLIKYLLLLALFFSACKIDRDKAVERDKFSFKTGDDTEIFFKNLRASDYEKEERKTPRWDIYRHEDLYSDTSGYAINIAIVVNIIGDEAYILVEPGEKLASQEQISIHWSNSVNSESGEIILQQQNKESMLEFAAQLFEAIREGKSLMLQIGGEFIPVFREENRKVAFKKTMADYFRLTRIF